MLVRLFYRAVWLPLLPLALLRLLWRARRQPAYLQHVPERLGRHGGMRESGTIWVHAVSVGETRAAEPLVRRLLEHWPTRPLVLTCMTPTGRETAQALFGGDARVRIAYLPYDITCCVERFLDHFDPAVGVIMETELWPTLLGRCATRGVPVLLANARLSARSAKRYARAPTLTRMTLGALRTIAAQTEEDAARFRALGARQVRVTGNIKFDITPPQAALDLGATFRRRFGTRKVLLLASARDGEEAALLDALPDASDPGILIVIVPRHPQRFEAVAQLLRSRGLPAQRRSDDAPVASDTRFWLGDSMGEMFAYYAAADVTLMGGSWLPFGGQNLIESCATGTPVLIGPHTWNFAMVADQAVSAGAAIREQNLASGAKRALELLDDDMQLSRMRNACLRFAETHRGATERTIACLQHEAGRSL